VVLEQCQFLDGNSGARVAEAVVDELRDLLGGETASAVEPTTQAMGR
jgi:hypothetical protein